MGYTKKGPKVELLKGGVSSRFVVSVCKCAQSSMISSGVDDKGVEASAMTPLDGNRPTHQGARCLGKHLGAEVTFIFSSFIHS
jgi:hypothetical protein